MVQTFTVSIPMFDAMGIVENSIVGGSITGEKIDQYRVDSPSGSVVVMVFEKHFYRAGNRLTLSITLDNLTGVTRVHTTGGGGGQGLLRFDWGAADSFENSVANALAPYRLC